MLPSHGFQGINIQYEIPSKSTSASLPKPSIARTFHTSRPCHLNLWLHNARFHGKQILSSPEFNSQQYHLVRSIPLPLHRSSRRWLLHILLHPRHLHLQQPHRHRRRSRLQSRNNRSDIPTGSRSLCRGSRIKTQRLVLRCISEQYSRLERNI